MKLAYDFDIEDWTSFQRYHYSASPAYRRMRNVSRLVLPAIVVLIIAVYQSLHRFDPFLFIALGLSALLWFIFYPRLFDRRVIRKSIQFLREGKMENVFGPREIELLPDSLRVVSPSAETVHRASAFVKMVETPDALLLYVSAIQALIIPRRKVSEVEFHAAREFVQQHYIPAAA